MPVSVPTPASQFRVEKARTNATLFLSNGLSLRGAFFVAGSSATHAGPERVKDVLNAEQGFFPFEVSDEEGARQTKLYNRAHVMYVELDGNAEATLDPAYGIATRRTVAMLFSNGDHLNGIVRVDRPQGNDRLSDFARSPEEFRYLETEASTYLVNVHHLIELVEEGE
jgi:hypothetical protein